MALAAQNMDGTSNEIDYRDIFGTIRAGKGDWDGSILIFILNVVNEFQVVYMAVNVILCNPLQSAILLYLK